MKLIGADILIKCLAEQGVDTIFGYPGGAALDIYDALYRDGNINHILTAHEQGAAHAADGYARATGKVGVCFATSGPGATNLVTGIATAYLDSIPIVAITSNVGVSMLGRDSFQEVDICGITMPITKHNYIVKDVSELADTVREAFLIASSGRKGPVLIDIPKNIQTEKADYEPVEAKKYSPKAVAPDKVKGAVEHISKCKKPLIMAGGGVIASGAGELLVEFAEKIDAPVASTLMGLGAIPSSHERSLGMIGMHGTTSAAKACLNADTIIAIGTRFSDRVALNRNAFAKGKTVIHIDIDIAEHNKNINADYFIMADVKKTLETMLPMLEKSERREWSDMIKGFKAEEQIKADTPIMAYEILKEARKVFPYGSPIVTDVGQHQMWTAQYFNIEKPNSFISSGGLGTMGYGMGAAIGACMGTGKKTLLVTGDGSFHMNMNELATAVTHNLPIVILLMNNKVLGMVRQWQKLFYGKRFSQTIPERRTDYPLFAKAMGATGYVIESRDDIVPVLEKAMNTEGPVLIDCKIGMDDNVIPMIKPGAAYETQITKMEEN